MRARHTRTFWLLGAVAVLCALVGLAGVVAVPDAQPRRASRSAGEEVADASPRVAARHDERQSSSTMAPSTEGDVQRTMAPEEPVRVRVRFRLANLGMADTHYVGPLQLHVDGAPLPPLQVVNRDPIELNVPRGARLLHCDAPGCKPVDKELPPHGKLADEVLVKFWADASLTFSTVGLPSDWLGNASFEAQSKDHEVRMLDLANWQPGSATQCEFLPGADFTWRAMLRSGGSLWQLTGREPALQVGELRTVVVDCHGRSPVHHQVVGPSPQLLSHLIVLVQPTDGQGTGSGVKLPLTDTGRFDLFGDERCTFAISVAGGFEQLRAERTAEGVLLRPGNPLVGLQLRDRSGQPVEFSLARGGPALTPVLMHVFERVRLPERLDVPSHGAGLRRIRTADLPTDTDVIDLDRVQGELLGSFVARMRGSFPFAAVPDLQVVRTDGTVVAHSLRRTGWTTPLEAGTYAVRWSVAGVPGPWVARQLSVRAGATTEIDAQWPVLVEWTGEVAGHLETPPAQRFSNVRFGEHPRLASGTWMNVDTEGRFHFGLEDAAEPGDVVELRCVFMNVRATIVSMDRARHHVVVRPPADLRWVDVRVDVDTRSGWVAWLTREGHDLPWMMLWSREQRAVVVPPGVVLGGALYTGSDLRGDLLAWFEVDGTQSPVIVRRAAGRMVEFLNTGASGRTLTLVGPRGQRDAGHALTGDAPLHLFVPDGTRGFRLDDPRQPAAERREQAIGSGDRVLVP